MNDEEISRGMFYAAANIAEDYGASRAFIFYYKRNRRGGMSVFYASFYANQYVMEFHAEDEQ